MWQGLYSDMAWKGAAKYTRQYYSDMAWKTAAKYTRQYYSDMAWKAAAKYTRQYTQTWHGRQQLNTQGSILRHDMEGSS